MPELWTLGIIRTTMKMLTISLIVAASISVIAGSITFTNSEGTPVTYVASYLHPFRGPQAYKDADSGVVFYVESDGRHVSAISPDGRILWCRDPFADSHLEFYRTMTLHIIYIGKASPRAETYLATNGIPKIIGITYDLSQFGEVDTKTGDFKFGGQD